MNNVDFRRLDMTLLLVFHLLAETGKLTTAADRLGLTQSAVSHALKRLREITGDPLFERSHRGMRPTRRAEVLLPTVRQIIELSRSIVEPPEPFTPERAKGVVKIGAADMHQATLFRRSMRRMFDMAPGLQLRALRSYHQIDPDALIEGRTDIALGQGYGGRSLTVSRLLYRDPFVVLARQGHEAFLTQITPERYAGLLHLQTSPNSELTGRVDDALSNVGLRRRVVASLPLFSPTFCAMTGTDLVTVAPLTVARFQAGRYGLECHAPPVPLPPIVVEATMLTSRRSDPMLDFVMDVIVATGAEIAAELAQDPLGTA